MTRSGDAAASSYRDLLRAEPDFRRLWVAAGLSATGDAAQLTAVLWLATTAGSPGTAAAVFTLALTAPAVVVAPWAGVVADRSGDRRRLLVRCDLGRSALAAAMALAVSTPWAFVGLLIAMTALESVFSAATYAAVPDLVGSERLVRANGLLVTTEQACYVAGTALGGLLVAVASWLPFVVNAATFVGSALLIASIRRTALARPPADHPERGRFLEAFGEGSSFVWRSRPTRYLVLLGVVATIGFAPAPIAMVVLMADELSAPASAFGLVQVAATLGLLAGAAITGRLAGKGHHLIAAYLVLAAATAGVAVSPHVGLVLVLMLMRGGANGMTSVLGSTLLQLSADSRLRGRTLALASACYETARLVSIPLAGVAVDQFGPRMVFVIMSGVLVVAAFVAVLAVRATTAVEPVPDG